MALTDTAAQTAMSAKETSFRQWIGSIDPAVNTDSRAEAIDGLIKFLADNDIQCPSDLDDME